MKNLKIEHVDRVKLVSHLKKFYGLHPKEKYTIFQFVRWFKQRHKGKIITTKSGRRRVGTKQTYMPVIATTGVGKSLFGLMTSILYGRPFGLDTHVSYLPKDLEVSKMLEKVKFSTFIIDEAITTLRSLNWQNKDQQKITAEAQTERYKANWVFMMIPNFNELTKSIRAGSSEFRAYLPYRTETHARVIIQKKSRNFRNDDPWSDKVANKKYEKLEKRRKELTNEVVLDVERKLPNYVMDFIIPNLEVILPDVCDEYDKLKQESRIKQEESVRKKDFWKEEYAPKITKALYNDRFNLKEGARITHDMIAKEGGITPAMVSKLLN